MSQRQAMISKHAVQFLCFSCRESPFALSFWLAFRCKQLHLTAKCTVIGMNMCSSSAMKQGRHKINVSLEPHFLAKLHFSHQESLAYWATIVINNKQFPSAADFVLNVPRLYWVKSDQWLKLPSNHHSVSMETTKWQNCKGNCICYKRMSVCLFVAI